jgi:hypothetical protein
MVELLASPGKEGNTTGKDREPLKNIVDRLNMKPYVDSML